jgi:adenosylcobyric acid synthase
VTRWRTGAALGRAVRGYQIHHGRTHTTQPWITLDDGDEADGCRTKSGRVVGTSLHGLLEADGFRSQFLAGVAERSGRAWAPSGVSYAAARETRFDRLADQIEAHLDVAEIERLIGTARRP